MNHNENQNKYSAARDLCRAIRNWPEDRQEEFFTFALASVKTDAPWPRDCLRQLIVEALSDEQKRTGIFPGRGSEDRPYRSRMPDGEPDIVRACRDWGVGP